MDTGEDLVEAVVSQDGSSSKRDREFSTRVALNDQQTRRLACREREI